MGYARKKGYAAGAALRCLALATAIFLFAACSPASISSAAQAPASSAGSAAPLVGNGLPLEIMTHTVGVSAEFVRGQMVGIAQELGISINVSSPGDSYEELMKVRMASNNLPDIWFTHGWSTTRYKEYLQPLNDQPFADTISQMVLGLVTDQDGNIRALPLDYEVSGLLYNKSVLAGLQVDADNIRTWDDFEAVCEKAKQAGIAGVFIGANGGDRVGVTLNRLASSLVTNENEENQRALLNGSFDWNRFRPVYEKLDSWHENGFLNSDFSTADSVAGYKALGEGRCVFLLDGPIGAVNAKTYVPDAEIGFLPIPAKDAGSKRSMIIAETTSLGVWCESKNQEAAFAVLEAMTREETVRGLCQITGCLSAVTTVVVKLSGFEEEMAYLQVNAGLMVPMFDRAYLPSGLWLELCKSGVTVYSYPGATGIDMAVDQIASSYKDRFRQ